MIDMSLKETLAKLALREERYVYSTAPERTRNPGYRPILLHPDTKITMIPFPRHIYVNDSDTELETSQDLEASEPGEEITLTLRPPQNTATAGTATKPQIPPVNLTPRSKPKDPENRLIIQDNKEVQ